MKLAMFCLAIPLGLAGGSTSAQESGDTLEKLRACSLLAHAERLECLDQLAHEIGPPSAPQPMTPAAATPAADNWIVSETTSPVDYTPIAIATASYRVADGTIMQLSIQCRGGRTNLVITGPPLTRRAEDYIVSYRIDDGPPTILDIGAPPAGTGIAVKGDVARLLVSLPDQGEIALQVASRQGASQQGRYALGSLKGVLKRLAGPCQWQSAVKVPRN